MDLLKWILVNCERRGACLEWTGPKRSDGYGNLRIDGKKLKVHRLMFELVNHPIKPSELVCHSCDNRACCEPDHLWLGNHTLNQADKFQKNRQHIPIGETNGRALVTESIVLEIRAMHASGMSVPEIRKKFRFGRTTIHAIVHRQNWKHIK